MKADTTFKFMLKSLSNENKLLKRAKVARKVKTCSSNNTNGSTLAPFLSICLF